MLKKIPTKKNCSGPPPPTYMDLKKKQNSMYMNLKKNILDEYFDGSNVTNVLVFLHLKPSVTPYLNTI